MRGALPVHYHSSRLSTYGYGLSHLISYQPLTCLLVSLNPQAMPLWPVGKKKAAIKTDDVGDSNSAAAPVATMADGQLERVAKKQVVPN